MNYNAYEQSKINEAKEVIRQAKRVMKKVNEDRQTRLTREQDRKINARIAFEAGIKQMVEDIKRTSPFGYKAQLESHAMTGLWTGTMTLTLVFKPLE